MKEYKDILVLENDIKEVPYILERALNKEQVPIEYWYNFNYSFYHNSSENFLRLKNLSLDTLVVTNPSFVGADNQFSGYLNLFLKMKEHGIKLDIAIIYYPNFFTYLLRYLANEQNYMKKENNHRMIKEVLDYHNVYEFSNTISDSVKITYESLMEYYIETHKKLNITNCRIKATGEVYPAYFVYYADTLNGSFINLYIENEYNNKFTFDEIEILK